jgi:hypothetical protein
MPCTVRTKATLAFSPENFLFAFPSSIFLAAMSLIVVSNVLVEEKSTVMLAVLVVNIGRRAVADVVVSVGLVLALSVAVCTGDPLSKIIATSASFFSMRPPLAAETLVEWLPSCVSPALAWLAAIVVEMLPSGTTFATEAVVEALLLLGRSATSASFSNFSSSTSNEAGCGVVVVSSSSVETLWFAARIIVLVVLRAPIDTVSKGTPAPVL